MEFHEKLRELRKSRGLTQEELAEALFVSRTAISKWESRRGYPSIDSLKEISRYFAVSIDDLLSGEQLITIAEKENNYAMCHEILNKMNKTVFNKKIVSKLEKEILIRETFDTIDAIEKEFPINTEYKLQNIDNASLLAIYYEKQKNKEKAIYYANYVLSQKTDMEEYYSLGNKVIEESKNY